MTILVSACLLGTACRYDGRSKADAAVPPRRARRWNPYGAGWM